MPSMVGARHAVPLQESALSPFGNHPVLQALAHPAGRFSFKRSAHRGSRNAQICFPAFPHGRTSDL
jgi:hypothetical protein